MMMVPDFRRIIKNRIGVLKFEPFKQNNISGIVGVQSCNLEMVAYATVGIEPVSICPWHWLVVERQDQYPFKRANAKCNCRDCQAKTIYDTDSKKLSSCFAQFVLMPTLLREAVVNQTERWSFHLEEVAVSCACSIFLSIQS